MQGRRIEAHALPQVELEILMACESLVGDEALHYWHQPSQEQRQILFTVALPPKIMLKWRTAIGF